VDKSVTAVVIKGLAEHKDELGAPLCPCRHYDDKKAEAQQGFWNCPCVPMRERKARVKGLGQRRGRVQVRREKLEGVRLRVREAGGFEGAKVSSCIARPSLLC